MSDDQGKRIETGKPFDSRRLRGPGGYSGRQGNAQAAKQASMKGREMTAQMNGIS